MRINHKKEKEKEPGAYGARVTLRLDVQTNEFVTQIAEDEMISKSEVVRLALTGAKEDWKTRQGHRMTKEDREEILFKLVEILTVLGKVRNDNKKLGRNVNQIAKASNMGYTRVSEYEMQTYFSYGEYVKAGLEELAKEVHVLWRTFG
ncbi:hypothetical protein [Alkalicoccus saliphilus]|uniref:hypothetical protein n=1 Tax=Alkalicoccus saliphilus TaxID=200989 RepID=UPI0011B296E9|nr:hypothetical protein [Alkalicoccus saliphilus]